MQGQKTIGIVGGGQLGRMLTLAALPLGFKVVVINPGANSPAAQVGAEEIVADLYDPKAIKELAGKSDFITVEIEHLNTGALETVAKAGTPVNPAPQTIRLIQDKFLQKEFLAKHQISVAKFAVITDAKNAHKLLKEFGGKMLVKARHGAYDGRGNALVRSTAELDKALKDFEGRDLYAEAFVPFKKELAIMVARDIKGNIKLYPLVETIHQRNICLETLAPADINDLAHKRAITLAKKVASKLEGAGVFGIEMFLTKDDKVLINEIAPRVHNSGHYTMDANRTSQFEQHIRAITGMPLGSTDLLVPASVMINILGERDGPTKITGLRDVMNMPHTSVHLYGKSPTKVDRKMGHINVTAADLKTAQKKARQARRKIDV